MHTAGTDPGYIPGLTSPRPADAEEEAPEETVERPPQEADAEKADAEKADAEEEVDAAENADAEEDAEAESEEGDDPEEGDDAEDAEDEDGGVAFDVSDRRGAIAAGRTGIAFRLDDQEAEFGWDEIGAVEIDTPRFGKRFSVTVYTTNRRWYEADVEASARSLLKEWTAQLDAVLDAYFEGNADDA
ncbi:hypothetical protein ABZS71_07995 [Streptomyces sp. NPDC005393]|uniref:hypothetical protein n=1 Tax=Streptomyces sp. NPDC005393 TaxID=3157041 RepID=UPI0033BE83DD